MRRRLALASCAALALAGCGFRLRGPTRLVFATARVEGASPVADDVRAALRESGVLLLAGDTPERQAEVVVTVANELRQRVVVGRTASGQVRELQLRLSVRLRAVSARGVDLILDTEIAQQREISYSETAALAKEGEEALLNADMQGDIVQQVMRRLAAIKSI